MKIVLIIVSLLTAISFIPITIAAPACVTVDGKEYCTGEKQVTIGELMLDILDPFALLDKAEEEQAAGVTKISLWDNYDYPPFIVELAKQNNMSAVQLIDLAAEQDITPNPWRTLKELESLYPELIRVYDRSVVDGAIDKAVKMIIDDVLDQITIK